MGSNSVSERPAVGVSKSTLGPDGYRREDMYYMIERREIGPGTSSQSFRHIGTFDYNVFGITNTVDYVSPNVPVTSETEIPHTSDLHQSVMSTTPSLDVSQSKDSCNRINWPNDPECSLLPLPAPIIPNCLSFTPTPEPSSGEHQA